MEALLGNVEFWKAIATFAWPLTVLIIALTFRKIFERLTQKDQMTFQVGGLEISVAQAAKQTGEGLSDLQARVAKLEDSDNGTVYTPPLAPALTKTASQSDPALSILWGDDNPANNAFLIEKLERDGCQIRKELSTSAAMAALRSDRFDIVISDLGRVEDGRANDFAGLDLLSSMKEKQITVPTLIFAGNRGLQNESSLLAAGARMVTSSAVDVFQFVAAHSGRNS